MVEQKKDPKRIVEQIIEKDHELLSQLNIGSKKNKKT